jgi:hypothetical protein|tara:strand:+ start:658 stop:969 length:312 start_codon:yes stop_codon:yes gene_type:complete
MKERLTPEETVLIIRYGADRVHSYIVRAAQLIVDEMLEAELMGQTTRPELDDYMEQVLLSTQDSEESPDVTMHLLTSGVREMLSQYPEDRDRWPNSPGSTSTH